MKISTKRYDKILRDRSAQLFGSLTIEQLYFDRESFLTKVREEAIEDLESMGIQIVSYTITAISDRDGYMDALGQTQLAKVKREAKEGAAKHDAAARTATTKYESRRSHVCNRLRRKPTSR